MKYNLLFPFGFVSFGIRAMTWAVMTFKVLESRLDAVEVDSVALQAEQYRIIKEIKG